MYKKSAVKAVGSYQDFYLLEDYYLWLRMLMAGYHGYSIQAPLLHMRAGSDMYKRRAGWRCQDAGKTVEIMNSKALLGMVSTLKVA